MLVNRHCLCVRLVAPFPQAFIKSYVESVDAEQATKVREALVLGIAYGFSQVRNHFSPPHQSVTLMKAFAQ